MKERPIRRILAVNLNYLGDALFTTPALATLRAAFPHATLDVLAGERAAAVLSNNPAINELLLRPPRGGAARAANLAQTLRSGQYDAVVLFQSTFANALLAWTERIPVRIGFSQDGCGPLLTHAVPARHDSEHVVDAYTRLADAAAKLADTAIIAEAGSLTGPDDSGLSITVSDDDVALADNLLKNGPEPAPTVGLVIGATRPQKRWPEEYWVRLADKLWSTGVRSILLGGPEEGDAAERILAQVSAPVASAVGQTTEKQLAALVSRLGVVVSGDSGPLHIATAMRTPVVALFGSTDPADTGPWYPDHIATGAIVLYDKLACAPCGKHPTCDGRWDCLRALTPERVYDAACDLLGFAPTQITLPVVSAEGHDALVVPDNSQVDGGNTPDAMQAGGVARSRPRRLVPESVQRVAVLTKHHYMGDAIVSVPLLRSVRQAFPDAHVTLVTGRQAAAALENCPHFDRLLCYSPRDRQYSADSMSRLLAGEHDETRPDVCLIVDRSLRSAWIALKTGASVRAGFVSEGRALLLTHRIRYDMDVSEIQCFLDILRAVVPETRELVYDPKPQLWVTDAERERGAALLAEHGVSGSLLVAMQPGASYPQKQWASERYAQVAQHLTEHGATILLVGAGKAEQDAARLLCESAPNTPIIDMTGATTLRETMGVLTHVSLFIGNDTGVNHIAASLGLATVALFGPTRAKKWGHVGPNNLVLSAPGGDLGRLDVGPVLDASCRLLSRIGRNTTQ